MNSHQRCQEQSAGAEGNHQAKNRVSSGGRIVALLVMGLWLLALTPAQAATNAWSGGAGADLSWSNSANWTNGAPTATTDVYFWTNGATASPGTPNNTVDANTTIQSLSLQNTNPTTFHTTLINSGATLTVSNGASTGIVLVGGGAYAPSVSVGSYMQGGGSLVVNASNATMSVRQSVTGTSGSPRYTLDMSGLDNFTAYLSRMYVGGDGGNRPMGVLLLAKTNLISLGYSSASAASWLIGNTAGSGGSGGIVSLGMTNAVFCDGIHIAYQRSGSCLMNFNPATANGGVAFFRNRAGTGRQSYWRIGDGSFVPYSGNACNGTNDLSLGTVDAMVNELVVGRSQNTALAGAAVAGAVGVLTLGAGTLDANTVIAGYQMVDYGARVISTINVDGTAQLIVNSSMQLGRFMKANTANGFSSAKLNIGTISGGGSVVAKGGITTGVSTESLNQSEINIRNSGSLYVKGSVGPLYFLELSSGTLTLDVQSNPTSPVCTTTNLQTAPGFNLHVQGLGLQPGQFPLVKYQTIYGGSGADDLVFTLAPYLQGYLSNNIADSSIDLVITNTVVTVWNGDIDSKWDINSTANWKDGTTGASKTYGQATVPGDIVRFDDTATGTTTVTLTTDTLAPAQVTVTNSSKTYTFNGSGRLTGSTGLAKIGSGTLTIGNSGANDFAGGITIGGGTLQISGSADRLPTNTAVTLADASGAILDLNNQNQTLATISGGGASGGNISLGSGTLTLTAGSSYGGVISGTGKLVKTNSGTLTLSGNNLYSGGTLITSNNVVSVINTSGSGLGSGNINIEGGILYIGSTAHGSGGTYGDVAATAITNNLAVSTNLFSSYLYVNRSDDYVLNAVLYGSGQMYLGDGPGRVIVNHANYQTNQTTSGYGPVQISHPHALGTSWMLVGGLAGAALELINNITVTNTIGLNCKGGALGQPANVINVGDTNTLSGPINFLSGGSDWVFRSDAGKLILRGPMSNLIGATRNYWLRGNGDGEVFGGFPVGVFVSPFQPTNNFTKDGLGTWTLWGANTYNGTTSIKEGTLIVNGSLVAGASAGTSSTNVMVWGTLGGTGLITAPVFIYIGGTLSPGAYTETVGTLTVSNSLTFIPSSTARFNIVGSSADQVRGLTKVTYGGTLQIVASGTFAGNAVFKLFDATTYEGAFDAFDLPTPLPSPLAWDTSFLPVDGTLRIITTPPEVSAFGLAGDGNFQMSGTGAADQAYRILATTNVADLLINWIEVGSGTFAGGVFSFTDLGSTNYPRRFYRVVMP